MEPEAYLRMSELENRHWWFQARRAVVRTALRRYVELPPQARILAAGSGTGGNLAMLAELGRVSAIEPDAQGRALAAKKGPFDLRPGFLPSDIPFEPESFDLVVLLDVLEHLEEDLASLEALLHQVRPGGTLLVTTPAHPWLWSAHDDRHHHFRRYSKQALLDLARGAGWEPQRLTYYNFLLFGPIIATRLTKRWAGRATLDDRMPPAWLNGLLRVVFASERHLVGRVPLPPGVSLFLLATRPPSVPY